MDWHELTHDERVELMMAAGRTRAEAEREVAIAEGVVVDDVKSGLRRFDIKAGDLLPGDTVLPIVTAAELLAHLGVTDAAEDAQRSAVAEWLSANTPSPILAASLGVNGFADLEIWDRLTREQKIEALMETYGVGRPMAERRLAQLEGNVHRDVVSGLPPREPLTPRDFGPTQAVQRESAEPA